MTLRHLTVFVEVCRYESMTKAAVALNMTQPAVSTAIRELEEYYKVPLFERMNRKVYITDGGRKLLEYAQSILTQWQEAREVLPDTAAISKIRLGCNDSYATCHLPEHLKNFSLEYPEIPVYTQIQNTGQIEQMILHNQLDFGITDFPDDKKMFHYHFLLQERMAVVCNIPGVETVTLEELAQLPQLLREQGSGAREIVDAVFHQNNLQPIIAMESTSTQALIKSCTLGLGVLILSEAMLFPYIQAGQLKEVTVREHCFARSYYLIYHKSKFVTKSIKKFFGELQIAL